MPVEVLGTIARRRERGAKKNSGYASTDEIQNPVT